MRSATRKALVTGRDSLSSAGDSLTLAVGEELLSAGRLIGSSKQLSATLADAATESSRKQTLVDGVFGAQLSPQVVDILRAAVASSWSSPDDLLAGIEDFGIRAIAQAEGADSGIQNELLDFGRIVTSNPELELALGSKLGDSEAKPGLVRTLLSASANQGTIAILSHLVQQTRGRRIGALVSQAADAVADQFGKVIATVSVAKLLDADQLQTLSSKLESLFGGSVVINQTVDASVIGGIRIQVGDEIIDASVARRLQDLRLQLVG